MLSYVAPDDVSKHWKFVREGLQYIVDKTGDRWLPEDVYMHIKSGNMGLYMSDDGFAVLQPVKGWDGTELYIFCGYSRGGHDLVMQESEQIMDIAKSIGAKRVKFQSNRRGFEKLAQEMGYSLDFVQFEREVEYEI